jgi:predicted MPP superfamily phosphohydrolase
MQITDTHFGEDALADDKTELLIENLVRKEDPDFIAITGDLSSGYAWDS